MLSDGAGSKLFHAPQSRKQSYAAPALSEETPRSRKYLMNSGLVLPECARSLIKCRAHKNETTPTIKLQSKFICKPYCDKQSAVWTAPTTVTTRPTIGAHRPKNAPTSLVGDILSPVPVPAPPTTVGNGTGEVPYAVGHVRHPVQTTVDVVLHLAGGSVIDGRHCEWTLQLSSRDNSSRA